MLYKLINFTLQFILKKSEFVHNRTHAGAYINTAIIGVI